MAIKNKIPQFDSSKTNLGTAPVDGFKANTIVKSDEVNRAIYDCSLSITALIKALINTNGGIMRTNTDIDNSQSVDDIAQTLSLMLGLGLKKAQYIDPEEGDDYVHADRLTYNGLDVSLNAIDLADGHIIGKNNNGKLVIFGYPFDSFLIKRKTFICVTLSNFNENFSTGYIPIIAFFRMSVNVNESAVENINGGTLPFIASEGDIFPMYKQLEKIGGKYWFNYQVDKSGKGVNTILLLGSNTDYRYWQDSTIPCPNTGTIYVVGIGNSVIN